jgi:hypothetical protein
MCDLDHPVLAGVENTDSWHTRKGDLENAFPLGVMMVPSSVITTIGADAEYLTCGGFSLGETIHIGSFEFVADYFGVQILFPGKGDSQRDTIPTASHDRGLRRGVPHGVKWGEGPQPSLSHEAWHGVSIFSHHNHTMVKGHPRHRRRTTSIELPLASG